MTLQIKVKVPVDLKMAWEVERAGKRKIRKSRALFWCRNGPGTRTNHSLPRLPCDPGRLRAHLTPTHAGDERQRDLTRGGGPLRTGGGGGGGAGYPNPGERHAKRYIGNKGVALPEIFNKYKRNRKRFCTNIRNS